MTMTQQFVRPAPKELGIGGVSVANGATVSGLQVEECGSGAVRQVLLKFNNFVLPMTDGTSGCYGTLKLADFDLGGIAPMAYACDLTADADGTCAAFQLAVGTVAVEAVDADLDGTSTLSNFMTATSVATVTTVQDIQAAGVKTIALLDGSATALDLILNATSTTDASSGLDVTLNGEIVLTYMVVGNKTGGSA